MKFESTIESANPNKLYYALKELATKADKQDDLLVQDFAVLQSLDTEHIGEIQQQERDTKYEYFQKWIHETIDYCATLDAEKFNAGIAYMLLTLSFRLDYLLCPEGKLLRELEKITAIYFSKDEKPTTEKNALMTEAFKKMESTTKEEFSKHLFRSKSTFAIAAPQQYKAIADAIYTANQNMIWYKDNGYPFIAQQICEYGISFCQSSYSLPRALTDLFQLMMEINYSEYFITLGFTDNYYDPAQNKFNTERIIHVINVIVQYWRKKYPRLEIRTANLRFSSLVDFDLSFTNELQLLNFDTK